MANNKDLISNEVLQKATQDILQTVSEHLYDYEPYTDEQIAEIFDLDNVTAKSLSKVINDEYIAKNKVFSNEHTMELLSKTLAEANQYTTEQIANSGKLERKIVTSTSEVIDENILYLILTDSTNNIYTQYMLIDGNATPLGTTQINLNDYLKTIDFNTKIDEYAKKNTVVLQNDVVGDLTTLSSNQILSTQGVSDELDKKVDKSSIVTSIDSSSTDSQVPSAKSVYDNIINKLDNTIILKTADEVNSFNKAYQSFIVEPSVTDEIGLPNLPSSTWFCIHYSHSKGFKYPSQIAFEYAGLERIMYRTAHNGVWHNWRKVSTTSVADVPLTYISNLENETYIKTAGTKVCNYCVVNGICTLSLEVICLSTSNNFVQILSGLPKPRTTIYANAIDRRVDANSRARGLFQLLSDGNLRVVCNYGDTSVTGIRNFYVTFSYPVAES